MVVSEYKLADSNHYLLSNCSLTICLIIYSVLWLGAVIGPVIKIFWFTNFLAYIKRNVTTWLKNKFSIVGWLVQEIVRWYLLRKINIFYLTELEQQEV